MKYVNRKVKRNSKLEVVDLLLETWNISYSKYRLIDITISNSQYSVFSFKFYLFLS